MWITLKCTAVLSGAIVLASASSAHAQHAPIPIAAVDVRGALAFLGSSEFTAASLGVAPDDMPGKAWAGLAGLHLYPFRRPGFAIGIGGEVMTARAGHQTVDTAGKPTVPEVRRRFEGVSGQVSANFGHRNGWSYVSGGAGPLVFDTWLGDDAPDGVRAMTINVGGGARWFNFSHLAYAVDLRFYLTRPSERTLTTGERAMQRVMVLSVGVSLR